MRRREWLPGMRTKCGIRIISVQPDGYVEGFSEDSGCFVQVLKEEPDENDPVTKLVLTSYGTATDKE